MRLFILYHICLCVVIKMYPGKDLLIDSLMVKILLLTRFFCDSYILIDRQFSKCGPGRAVSGPHRNMFRVQILGL